MTDSRCFLQWFVLLLSYAAAPSFAGYCGLLQSIWNTDVTYIDIGDRHPARCGGTLYRLRILAFR
jgi:hypothetical protein